MKKVISNKFYLKWKKNRKKDESKLKTYWYNIYPEDYTDGMINNYQRKFESSSVHNKLIKIANDVKDVVFKGKIKKCDDGYVYVDIDDSIFGGILPLIGCGAEKPPKHKNNDTGAHITVIKQKESKDIDFKDDGKEISYKITGVKVVKPEGWEEMEKVWFVSVDSEDLEKIRTKYKLSPKIKDHDFHITVGVKKAS